MEALQLVGAPPGLFPPVVAAGQLVGRANGVVPLRLRGAALASAGHDHLCVAAGSGATRPGQLLDSCGTAEGMVRAVEPLAGPLRRVVEAGLSAGWHTLPGKYALLGGQTLGLVLDRVLALLGVDGGEPFATLDRQARGVPAGTLRLVQEHPYSDPSIVGIGTGASPAALWSAALDAMTEGARRLVQSMDSIAGPTEEVVLTGGWARCAGLRRRKRQMFRQVKWPAVAEAGRAVPPFSAVSPPGSLTDRRLSLSRTSSRRTRPLPMQKIINDPNAFVDEMLEGVLLAHPEDLRRARIPVS